MCQHHADVTWTYIWCPYANLCELNLNVYEWSCYKLGLCQCFMYMARKRKPRQMYVRERFALVSLENYTSVQLCKYWGKIWQWQMTLKLLKAIWSTAHCEAFKEQAEMLYKDIQIIQTLCPLQWTSHVSPPFF